MSCGEFVKGHVFDFNTLVCARCGMPRARFESTGEPRCAGEKPEPTEHEVITAARIPDDEK